MEQSTTRGKQYPFHLGGEPGHKWSFVRIAESLIIAGVTGLVTIVGMTLVLQERISNMQSQITETRNTVEQIRRDFYRPRFDPNHLTPGVYQEADAKKP